MSVYALQGAIGHALDELAVDLRPLSVMADSATIIHSEDGFRFSVFGFRQKHRKVIREGG